MDTSFEWRTWATVGGILIGAILLAWIVRRILGRWFADAARSLRVDPTNYRFFFHLVSALIYLGALILIVYRIPSLRTFSWGLITGAGVLAAILGFASQQAFSNIVGGIFIVIFKPFHVGDVIRLEPGGYFGVVEDITLRHTVIRTYDHHRIVIPNTHISSDSIFNYSLTDPRIRRFFEIGVSYESDIDRAMEIIREEAMAHPLRIDGRTEDEKRNDTPEVPTRLIRIEESQLTIRAWIWTRNIENAYDLHWDLNRSVKLRFDAEGIEIPYPQRTVHVREKDGGKARPVSPAPPAR